ACRGLRSQRGSQRRNEVNEDERRRFLRSKYPCLLRSSPLSPFLRCELRCLRPLRRPAAGSSGRNALQRPTPCGALTIDQAPTVVTISLRLRARRDDAQRQFVPPVSSLINALLDPRPSLLVRQLCRFYQHVM